MKNKSVRLLGYCPNDKRGELFCADIKAILKGTGFCCVRRGFRTDLTECSILIADYYKLYLRPIYSDMVNWHTESEVYKISEVLAIGMVLAVRKIHAIHKAGQ